MKVDMKDVISALERLRDDIAYMDAEDFEDESQTITIQLDGIIDVLYSDYVKGENDNARPQDKS